MCNCWLGLSFLKTFTANNKTGSYHYWLSQIMSQKSEVTEESSNKLYHERQVKELCALHALNNLLQKKEAFTKKDLDDICTRLSPDSLINPHRSLLGLGNYDVNVIMAALQEKGYETIWFDKRKKVNVLIPDKIMGFILNTPTDYKLGFLKLPIHRKHWIAIRWLSGKYMNLDSKLDSPSAIGDESSLLEYLDSELSNGDKELLLVVEKDVYESALWRRDSESGERKEEPKCSIDSNGVLSGPKHVCDTEMVKVSENGAVMTVKNT